MPDDYIRLQWRDTPELLYGIGSMLLMPIEYFAREHGAVLLQSSMCLMIITAF